jgi:hypothetical protein
MFLAWAGGNLKDLVPSVAELPPYATGNFKKIIAAWGSPHMQACQSNTCIKLLVEILDKGYLGIFKTAAWEAMNGIQMKALLEASNGSCHAQEPHLLQNEHPPKGSAQLLPPNCERDG